MRFYYNIIKSILCISLFAFISCGDDSEYPIEYCYSAVEVGDCLFFLVEESSVNEINISNQLKSSFELNVSTTLDEIVENSFSGIFKCIELQDETTAKISVEFNGQTEEAIVEYDLESSRMFLDNSEFILEEKGNDLALVLQASILFPGADNPGNPNAFVTDYTEASTTDILQAINQLNLENNYVAGDTVGVCLPKVIYKN